MAFWLSDGEWEKLVKGRREGGWRSHGVFSPGFLLAQLQFLTDSVSDLFHYLYLQLPYGILSAIPKGTEGALVPAPS